MAGHKAVARAQGSGAKKALIKMPAGAGKVAMPESVSPMLCTLTREPLNDPEYLYEIKWDGYRIISFVNGNKVKLHSRSGLDYTAKYPLVAEALKNIGHK